MSQKTLMLVEATGIQRYIFGSNQLAQNIGASELVTQATTDWVSALLPDANNMVGSEVVEPTPEMGDLDARVVYAGGGNAMIIFARDNDAAQFARDLTRKALEAAPGLSLVLKQAEYDPKTMVLRDLHQRLRGELAQRKLDRAFNTPLAGLGVTASCVYTGKPAVAVVDERLVSAEVQAKLGCEGEGNERLARQLPQVDAKGHGFVYNFDELGSKEESSYLAVIHTDGNDMGRRIVRLGEAYDTPEQNDDYIGALHRFSESVRAAAECALGRTADLLLDPAILIENKVGGVVPKPVVRGKPCLPFRPIVYGGDDVTFVCDGRLGLSLAAFYLAQFASQELSDGDLAHARAGVAVVHNHYPFSRAYELAEDLARSAKDYILEAKQEGLTALDWHFAVSGLVRPLTELRARQYTAPAGNLLMRPLRLNKTAGEWRSWATLEGILDEFQKPEADGGVWAGRRNKLKALRDALRAGPDATRLFLAGDKLPDIAAQDDFKTYGWRGDRCGYFDALEALDFYVPLKGGMAS